MIMYDKSVFLIPSMDSQRYRRAFFFAQSLMNNFAGSTSIVKKLQNRFKDDSSAENIDFFNLFHQVNHETEILNNYVQALAYGAGPNGRDAL